MSRSAGSRSSFKAYKIADSTAGWLVPVLAAVLIPVSFVAPILTVHHARLVIVVPAVCAFAAYTGMPVAPVGCDRIWMILAGGAAGFSRWR